MTAYDLAGRAARSASYRLRTWFVRPVLGEPSRLWHGNDAGWMNNVRGAAALRRVRGGIAGAAPVHEERIEALRRDGFLKLRVDVEPRALAGICASVDRLMRDPIASYPACRGGYSRRAIDLVRDVPDVRLLLTPEVRRLVEAWYGTFFEVRHVSCWRNMHVPNTERGREIYSDYWHCDENVTTLVKLFVNLSDVTAETGAFRLHAVPSTKDIMRAGFLTRRVVLGPARRMLEDPERVVIAAGPAGSAILCNTQLCLHRAAIPRPGSHRDIVEFKLQPAMTPLAEDWWRHVRPDGADQRELERRATEASPS